jgi:hypothetical protein
MIDRRIQAHSDDDQPLEPVQIIDRVQHQTLLLPRFV